MDNRPGFRASHARACSPTIDCIHTRSQTGDCQGKCRHLRESDAIGAKHVGLPPKHMPGRGGTAAPAGDRSFGQLVNRSFRQFVKWSIRQSANQRVRVGVCGRLRLSASAPRHRHDLHQVERIGEVHGPGQSDTSMRPRLRQVYDRLAGLPPWHGRRVGWAKAHFRFPIFDLRFAIEEKRPRWMPRSLSCESSSKGASMMLATIGPWRRNRPRCCHSEGSEGSRAFAI